MVQHNFLVILQFRLTYSQQYLFNANPDTNPNPNSNSNSKGLPTSVNYGLKANTNES